MTAHSKTQKSQWKRTEREDEECAKAVMEDRLQERRLGWREEKTSLYKAKEQNGIFSWCTVGTNGRASGRNRPFPVGFLVDQHWMVPGCSVGLCVTLLLSKLFLTWFINGELNWLTCYHSIWISLFFFCSIRGLTFFLTTFTPVSKNTLIEFAAVCYKIICSCQPLSKRSGLAIQS